MARDRKDRSASWYMTRHGGALLRLAHVQGIVAWKAVQTVLGYPKQIPDGLLDVTFAGKEEPDPFLIEIKSYPERDAAEQIRRDLAMVLLTRRVIPDILVLVLHPKGNLTVEPEQIAASAHRMTELRVKVQVINLWTVPAEELLADGDVGLIPWVPLTQFEGEPRAMLEQCRDRIEEQAPPEEVENLLAVTPAMAEMRYNEVKLLSLLGGQIMSFTKVLFETPMGQRVLAKERRKGERKAIEEKRAAVRNTLRKCVLQLLRERFGDLPKDLAARLRETDDGRILEKLHKLAAVCENLTAFQNAMKKQQ